MPNEMGWWWLLIKMLIQYADRVNADKKRKRKSNHSLSTVIMGELRVS
jgi:hypothetical protein